MKRIMGLFLAIALTAALACASVPAAAETPAFRVLTNSEGYSDHFGLAIDENGTAWQFLYWMMDYQYVKAWPVNCGGAKITQVAGDSTYAYALDENGTVWKWKPDLFTEPAPAAEFTGARKIWTAQETVFILTAEGKLLFKGRFSPHGYPADTVSGSDTEETIFDEYTEYGNTRGLEIRDVLVQSNAGILCFADGTYLAWNSNSKLYGLQELGRFELYDETQALKDYVYYYPGYHLAYAIDGNGTLYAAGNPKTCIGDSSIEGSDGTIPVSWNFHAIRPDTAFVKARGARGMFEREVPSGAIDRDGNVWAWGYTPAVFGREIPDAEQLTSGKAYTDFAFVGMVEATGFMMILDADGRLEIRGGTYGNEFVPYDPEAPEPSQVTAR